MKKVFMVAVLSTFMVMIITAKDFLIHLKSGDVVRVPVEEISEIRFDGDEAIPADPYPSATDFSHKSLLMEHTGVTCVHCPLMVMSLRELASDENYSGSYTLVGLHAYDGDPMATALVKDVSAKYRGQAGFPYLSANFKVDGYGSSENYKKTADNIRMLLDAEAASVVASGVSSSSLVADDRTIDLTLAVKAGEDGDFRVGAILVEDNIYMEQANSHTDITGDADFSTHNNVFRTIVGRDTEGGYTGIDLGHLIKGSSASTRQSIAVPEGWNLENCRFILYVTEKIDGKYVCVNSTYARISGTTPFEYDSSNPSTDYYVSLSKTFVELNAIGGEGSVDMTLASGVTPDELTLSTDAEWIKNLSVNDNRITFSVDINNTGSSREGRVTVVYGDARPIDISVRQKSSADETEDLFIIETSVVSPYAVHVSITPNGYDGNYVFFVAKASTIDKYINAGNIEGWIDGDIDFLQSMADERGLTLAEFLPSYSAAYALNGAPVWMPYSNLTSGMEYYAYCYGLTPDGIVTTPFYKKKFETTIVNKIDMTFEAEVTDITNNSANIKVIPSQSRESYYWTYVSEMDWVKYDLDFIMDTMIQNVLDEVQSGVDIYDIIHFGESTESVKGLWAGTIYHLVGWGMEYDGTPTTEPMEFAQFTTLRDDIVSECTFEVDIPEIRDNDILVHVVPSDNRERYYVACVEESLCEGYGDEQMAQRLINMENSRFAQSFYGEGIDWSNAEWVLSGEQSKWGRADLDWTFTPRHTYNVYVFGVDANGKRTTGVSRTTCKTIAPGESNLTVEVTLENATWDYGTFHFKPSNDDEYYMPFLVETSELQYVTNPDGTLDEVALCEAIEHYYDETPNYYTLRGEQTIQRRWMSDKDYTMLVCGWSGGNTTQFYRFETHTPKIDFGAGKGDVECDWELLDCSELAEIDYNRWKDYLGCVVIRLNFKPNEFADYYCGGVWGPVSNYADSGGVDHLLTLIQNPDASIVNRPSAMYRSLNYGVTYSLSYVAKDSEGRLGPWHYEEFTPTKGVNITPAYDFWSEPASSSMKVLAVSPEGETVDITSSLLPKNNVVKMEARQGRETNNNAATAANSARSNLGRN